jgi:asparagine synthase (glutamine-hydrolysing)
MIKALVPVCRTIKEFPAGSYLWSKDGEIRQSSQLPSHPRLITLP